MIAKTGYKNSGMLKSILELMLVTLGLSVSRAFMFVTSIIIARASDAQTFGQFALFTTIFLIVSEVPNAVNTTYIRFCNNAKDIDEKHRLFSTSLFLKIIIGLVFIVTGLLSSPLLAVHVFHKPESIQLIQISITSGALYSVYLTFVAYHQQKRNFTVLVTMRSVLNFMVLIILSSMFYLESEISIYDISTTYMVVISIMIVATVVFNMKNIKSDVFVDKNILRKFVQVSGLLVVGSLITLISNRLDVFFIMSFLDYESLGTYNVAVRISLILAVVSGSIRTIILPSAASAVHSKVLHSKYLITSFVYILVLVIITIPIIILRDPIISYTFGSNYSDAGGVVIILVFQAVLTGAAIPFTALIECGPHPRYTIMMSIIKLSVGAISLIFMVPQYGIYGAAIAITLTTSVALVLAILYSKSSRPAL